MFSRPKTPAPTARAPRATVRSVRAAQPKRGTAWSFTDEAIALIDRQIAVHRPERGGALITARDSRVIVDFVPDPRPGEQITYWHSPALRQLLNEYLSAHPTRRYGGTLHSHPGSYAEPSGPDHEAFATQLLDNPSVREALFPIVVQARRGALGSVLRLGEGHLVDLDHGTLAAYSATPDPESVEVRPAPVHVIPLRGDISHACAEIGPDVRAGSTFEVEVEGRYLPAVPVFRGDRRRCTVVFPDVYPSQPPLMVTGDGPFTPAWRVDGGSAEQLATALEHVLDESPPPGPVGADDSGETMESRLAHHLPGGITARYLVIGAGSVGSNAAEFLVRSGVTDLTVVDDDVVELPNLSRTTYERTDLGMPKVEALARGLRAINPAVEVRPVATRIQDLDLSVLTDIDVTILAADDLAAEFWLGHHLYHLGIPSVSIKMFERGEAGEVVTVVPEAGTACTRCIIGDAAGGGDRGSTDYGTGRLVAAPALGVDIVATVARGVRVALALGQGRGPLSEWLAPLIAHERTYFQHASVSDHPRLTALRPNHTSPAFDASWYRTGPSPECSVCGVDRVEPADTCGGEDVPDMLPPGVASTGSEAEHRDVERGPAADHAVL